MNSETTSVAAGSFADWLQQITQALRGQGGTDVPCGDCVGCCVSSYYIPLRASDAAVAAKVPPALLHVTGPAEAPQQWMAYDANGHCPMLRNRQCTVYEQRPQTCRDYDCRIFAAAGIAAGDATRSVINQRVFAWRFSYADGAEQRLHDAVRAAAAFIAVHESDLEGIRFPGGSTGIAVLALKAHRAFLDDTHQELDDRAKALAIIRAHQAFETADQAVNEDPHELDH